MTSLRNDPSAIAMRSLSPIERQRVRTEIARLLRLGRSRRDIVHELRVPYSAVEYYANLSSGRLAKQRPHSLGQRISATALAREAAEYPEQLPPLPKTRAECANTERPCSFIRCRHHLAIDINPWNGTIKLNYPDLDLDAMPETCSLDVAERGGETLQGVADLMRVVRERVRQIEEQALRRVLPVLREAIEWE